MSVLLLWLVIMIHLVAIIYSLAYSVFCSINIALSFLPNRNQVYPEHHVPKRRCESLSMDADYPLLMAGPDVQSLREAVSSITCCNEEEIVFA